MAIVSAADLAVLRTDGGSIAKVTDPAISDRVCSYRLAPSASPNAAWAFRPRKEAWIAFKEGGISVLDRGDLPYMCRTDITKFYPSICISLLQELLLERRCNTVAVRRVIRILEFWRTTDGLTGLPIGPEASAVLGNFFLDPVDRSIIATGAEHRRYGDDILIFTEGRPLSAAVVALLDSRLTSLQLNRSEEKTKYFDDPEEAKQDLRDGKIDYWDGAATYFPGSGTRAVRKAFDLDILNSAEINPSRYRWILNFLKNRLDDYGCYELVRRQDLMNVDPRVSCAYLRVAKSQKRVIEESLKLVSLAPQENFEALTLHTLLALSEARTGRDEAKEFSQIARDPLRPWPTRAAAWKALARSDGTKPALLMEATSAENEPNMRRAIITTLKRFAGDRPCRRFLKHISARYPETRYTVEWLKAAA